MFCSKCRIAVYVDYFSWDNCIETRKGISSALEVKDAFHTATRPTGDFVYHPRPVEIQPLDFSTENILEFTKPKSPPMCMRKNGLKLLWKNGCGRGNSLYNGRF